ncbi:DUF4435 domain-containing protein [uncultured Pseudomonas sp.]|uniref:DUF4435 domain-containing protein n=1 Tax=uncultured Pseudomonas sp. TaxID=114707 RepID=UPI00258A484B|nr:DUF4435 domain-containing protein [uncultured Pseudomonas sp.]
MNSNILKYSADELLGLAKISGTPIVIVEGFDDVPIYERISDSTSVSCLVFASENILCEAEGCEGVIRNISVIRDTCDGLPVEKYILGIIDRDARFYRNTVPTDPALMILDFYSIESHFVSQHSVRYLIPRVTRATNRLIQEQLCEQIYNELRDRLMFLYLVSLEALKNACIPDYKSAFGYKDSIKSIVHRQLHTQLEQKKEQLIEFGSSLNLTGSWQDILKICKGKWILEMFTDELFAKIINLPDLCKLAEVNQCQFCAKGEVSKCLYKNPSFFSADIMRSQLFHNIECDELQYVRGRIKRLLN